MELRPDHELLDYSTTVVIPTRRRPLLLDRAIDSVLAQTIQPLEIVVVVDGDDPNTVNSLRKYSVPGLQILILPNNLGVSNARNQAISVAHGAWVAFLDDDDEWFPTKLERQVEVAMHSRWYCPIVCSRMIVRSPEGDLVLPRRPPAPGETIGDYLFSRRSVFPGESLLQSSNLFTSRRLLETVPFQTTCKKWEDIDWLLRASILPGVGLEFLPEPLSVYYADHDKRLTMTGEWDWKHLFAWVKLNRHLLSPKAYSGALLVSIAHEAVRERDQHAFSALLWNAVKHGEPDMRQLGTYLALHLAHWIVPFRLHAPARHLLQKVGQFLELRA